jgi:hypothetical protein
MTLSPEERERFLTSLRADATFRDEVRREVLTEALLGLPERLAAFAEGTERRFEAIDRRFDAIDRRFEAIDRRFEAIDRRFEAIDRRFEAIERELSALSGQVRAFVEATNLRFDSLEGDMDRLKDDSGKLRGMVLEQKIRTNPGYYLRRHARKVHLVDLDDLLEDVGIEDLSDDDYAALGRTDVLARGTAKESGAPLVFVVEATWRVHSGDVDRLVLRREILKKGGIEAVALVSSVEPPAGGVRRYAARQQVLIEPEQLTEAV